LEKQTPGFTHNKGKNLVSTDKTVGIKFTNVWEISPAVAWTQTNKRTWIN